MQYMLLLYCDEAAEPAMGTPEGNAYIQGYMTVTEEMQRAGVFVAGDGLQPVATATTVRARNGEVQTTDGPFAETKEMLGGYYLLECKDLDEAIGWAAKIPAGQIGSIEIRPVMVFD